jgi:hypothetical protein
VSGHSGVLLANGSVPERLLTNNLYHAKVIALFGVYHNGISAATKGDNVLITGKKILALSINNNLLIIVRLHGVCSLPKPQYLVGGNFINMERNRKGKLTVRGNGGEEYIKLKNIICLHADGGCCEVYHLNKQHRTVARAVGTDPLIHYAGQAKDLLCSMGRKAWVNPNYVSGIRNKGIVFSIQSELLPQLTIPRKMLRKVKDLLRGDTSKA